MDEEGCKGLGGHQKHWGHACFHINVAKNAPDLSDRKSGKWSKVREKSGNFVMKIEWHPGFYGTNEYKYMQLLFSSLLKVTWMEWSTEFYIFNKKKFMKTAYRSK